MSAKNSLKTAGMALLLLGLAACGNKDTSSSKKKESNPVCTTINCLSSVTWKIHLQGQIFPGKTRVDVNDETVLDECHSKQQYRIDREAAPQSLTLVNHFVPKQGRVKVHIIDRGHCDEERSFLLKEGLRFEVVKGGISPEVHINL